MIIDNKKTRAVLRELDREATEAKKKPIQTGESMKKSDRAEGRLFID